VYPWYLLYFTPFLFSAATLPLSVWTLAVIPVYTVWEITSHGGRWVVPTAIVVAEFGLPGLVGVLLLRRRLARRNKAAAIDELLP
jgi:hypothetical protein